MNQPVPLPNLIARADSASIFGVSLLYSGSVVMGFKELGREHLAAMVFKDQLILR